MNDRGVKDTVGAVLTDPYVGKGLQIAGLGVLFFGSAACNPSQAGAAPDISPVAPLVDPTQPLGEGEPQIDLVTQKLGFVQYHYDETHSSSGNTSLDRAYALAKESLQLKNHISLTGDAVNLHIDQAREGTNPQQSIDVSLMQASFESNVPEIKVGFAVQTQPGKEMIKPVIYNLTYYQDGAPAIVARELKQSGWDKLEKGEQLNQGDLDGLVYALLLHQGTDAISFFEEFNKAPDQKTKDALIIKYVDAIRGYDISDPKRETYAQFISPLFAATAGHEETAQSAQDEFVKGVGAFLGLFANTAEAAPQGPPPQQTQVANAPPAGGGDQTPEPTSTPYPTSAEPTNPPVVEVHTPTPEPPTATPTPDQQEQLKIFLERPDNQKSISQYASALGLKIDVVISRLLQNDAIVTTQDRAGNQLQILWDPKTHTPLFIKTDGGWSESTLLELGNRAQLPVGTFFGHTEVAGMKNLYSKEFAIAEMIHDFGWQNVEPQEGAVSFKNQPNFARAEEYMNFALNHNMRITTGFLFFTEQYPDWFVQGKFSQNSTELPSWINQEGYTQKQLAYLAKSIKHVNDVTSYVRSKIETYKVQHPGVNIEPPIIPVLNEFSPLSWGRDDVLQRIFPDKQSQLELVKILYRTTREAYPEAVLIYNDYRNDSFNYPATNNTKEIVDYLSKEGLIDGVGMQFHIDASEVPGKEEWINVMRTYTDILQRNGVQNPFIIITEKDINLHNIPGTPLQRFKRQAEIEESIIAACDESGVCLGIINFNVGDPYSWLEEIKSAPGYSKNADATIFDFVDGRFIKKAAYYAEARALLNRILRLATP